MGMDISITAVIPTHNRRSTNLANLLRSLVGQDDFKVDIIIIDTSDDIIYQTANRAISTAYCAHYMRLPRRDFWKARSLNIGIAASDGRYTMCVDADMYIHPEFLSTVAGHFHDREVQPFIMAVCGYLPDNFAVGDWDEMRAKASEREVSRRLSPGGIQLARTSWFKKVGGYDEKFTAIDGVDTDMMVRARKYGLEEVWVEDPVMVMHQWHPKSDLKGMDSHKFSADPEVYINKDWLAW